MIFLDQSNNGITTNNVIETTTETLLDASGNGDLDDDLDTIGIGLFMGIF